MPFAVPWRTKPRELNEPVTGHTPPDKKEKGADCKKS
jgi:hypothetical protein